MSYNILHGRGGGDPFHAVRGRMNEQAELVQSLDLDNRLGNAERLRRVNMVRRIQRNWRMYDARGPSSSYMVSHPNDMFISSAYRTGAHRVGVLRGRRNHIRFRTRPRRNTLIGPLRQVVPERGLHRPYQNMREAARRNVRRRLN